MNTIYRTWWMDWEYLHTTVKEKSTTKRINVWQAKSIYHTTTRYILYAWCVHVRVRVSKNDWWSNSFREPKAVQNVRRTYLACLEFYALYYYYYYYAYDCFYDYYYWRLFTCFTLFNTYFYYQNDDYDYYSDFDHNVNSKIKSKKI